MKLSFRKKKENNVWNVNVFQGLHGLDEILEETQYQEMFNWCRRTFNLLDNPKRVIRSDYDTFQFVSERDMNWFIVTWSTVDNPKF